MRDRLEWWWNRVWSWLWVRFHRVVLCRLLRRHEFMDAWSVGRGMICWWCNEEKVR